MKLFLVVALVVGLIIGFAAAYIILEQRVSQLEAKIVEKDLMIDQFFTMFNTRATRSPNAIVDAIFTLSSSAEHRDYHADLKKNEKITVQLRVMGAPVDFYINLGTRNLVQKSDILSEYFNWTVPEDGRYVFRTQLKGEYALVNLGVHYYWLMIGGGTAGQEKVAVVGVEVKSATDIRVLAMSVGGGDVTIDGALLRDSAGQISGVAAVGPTTLPKDGTLTEVICTFSAGVTAGNTYTITLTSKGGGSFVSASFEAP